MANECCGEELRVTYEVPVYVCPTCGQRWWCYNTHYDLWGKVDDDATWENIKHGCPCPVSIGDPSRLLFAEDEEKFIKPAYRFYDDKEKVPYPKVLLEDLLPEPEPKEKEPIVFIQWGGDYEPSNICGWQFRFPVCCSAKKIKLEPDKFRVVYLGQIKQWQEESMRAEALLAFKEKEKYIVYLISSHFPVQYKNGLEPTSFIAEVMLIGDPNVGAIKPEFYYDPTVLSCAFDMVKK